jgi:hypothetical protein
MVNIFQKIKQVKMVSIVFASVVETKRKDDEKCQSRKKLIFAQNVIEH